MDAENENGWNAEELESVDACPACGEVRVMLRYQQLRDFLEGIPGRWSMHGCRGCGSLFLSPRPTRKAIGKAYASYYTHDSGASAQANDNGHSLFWKLANGYMNARFGVCRSPSINAGRWIFPWLPTLRQQIDFFYRNLPGETGRILDVGCGNGVFLLRAVAAGWTAVGVEPDPVAAVSAQASGLHVVNVTMEDFHADDAFDAVTASHVIEHVHDPQAFVEQLAKQLRPGGMVWLATPNAKSLGHRWFGQAWRGLEPPRHITVFSFRALRFLISHAGFTHIRFHRRGRGSRYILDVSHEIAWEYGMKTPHLSTLLVDLCATMFATVGEELVVTARKARP